MDWTAWMAWIKMRTNLSTDPRVVSVHHKVHKPVPFVIGALWTLWALADDHTTDGQLSGYTPASIDKIVGIKGFCEALQMPHVQWLTVSEKGFVSIPEFSKHNGSSAKKRANNAARMGEERANKNAQESHTPCTEVAPEKRREEKKREEEPKAPAAKPPEVSTDPAKTRTWTDCFVSEWAKAHKGTKYPFHGGKDGPAVKRIMADLQGDFPKFQRVCKRYFKDADPFVAKNGHGLAFLSSRLAAYVADPITPKDDHPLAYVMPYSEVEKIAAQILGSDE